jgi:dihydrofolate reductase
MRSIIVAYDQNRGIGAANDLLWKRDIPADLRRFKELTTGSAIIMGRKTYESIRRPLPNRQNIVISRQGEPIEGVTVVTNLNDAYAAATTEDIYIIGGGQIYELALDSVDQILATEVDASFPAADVFFPELDETVWQESSREHHAADENNKYPFDFVIYTKQR